MLYFDLFDLPVSFTIDKTALAERYRDLQRTVHPDKFASASDQERRLAMQKATQINEAFATLKHPLKRAQYLLQAQGIDASGEHASVMDNAFLFEQMELRESLEGLALSRDVDAIAGFMEDIDGRIHGQLRIIEQQFEDNTLEAAESTVQKLQFLYKLQDEALNLEDAIG